MQERKNAMSLLDCTAVELAAKIKAGEDSGRSYAGCCCSD